MSRRTEWTAILAGVLLLTGGPVFEQGLSWVESRAQAALPEVSAAPSAHERIRHVVLRENPTLGPSRADRIADSVLRCERDQGLRPEIVLAVMRAESGFRPDARSPKGALGLMQVMPCMFQSLELPGNPAHIETNIQAACMLLADNIRRLGEDEGILAYFWGSKIRGDGYLRRVRSMVPDLDAPSDEPSRGSN